MATRSRRRAGPHEALMDSMIELEHDTHAIYRLAWREPHVFEAYSIEDDWLDNLSKLPDSEHVQEILSQLRISTLRELSIDVVNGGFECSVNGNRLEFLRLLNSWIATAEETLAAGGRVSRIASRRRKP